MNEKIEFLTYLHKTAEMGVQSTCELLSILNDKENKIKVLVDKELKEYETSLQKIEKVMKNFDIPIPSAGIMAKAGNYMGMHMELMSDNSDAKVADMLIQGYTMGVLEVTKRLKKFKNYIDKEDKKLADELLDFQNHNIKELQKYL